jgi:hypothetical protein
MLFIIMKGAARPAGLVLAGVLIAGTSLAADRQAHAIPICLENRIRVEDAVVLEHAELIANQIFSRIGLRIEWHNYGQPCPTDNDPVLIRINNQTPLDYWPGAFGISMPFEGFHVEIFYDRIRVRAQGNMLSALTGHVLAHEITHILEGTNAHTRGVMNRQFTASDMETMSMHPLEFSQMDILLLRNGISSRRSHLAEIRRGGSFNRQAAEVLGANRPRPLETHSPLINIQPSIID